MADQKPDTPDQALELLRKASEGLMYPSESEAPFDVFRWKPSGPDSLKDVQAHAKKGAAVQEQPVDEFFNELQESEDAQRFAELRRKLESVVSGLKVYRVGKINIDVYLVGKAGSGDWVGLHTSSVET